MAQGGVLTFRFTLKRRGGAWVSFFWSTSLGCHKPASAAMIGCYPPDWESIPESHFHRAWCWWWVRNTSFMRFPRAVRNGIKAFTPSLVKVQSRAQSLPWRLKKDMPAISLRICQLSTFLILEVFPSHHLPTYYLCFCKNTQGRTLSANPEEADCCYIAAKIIAIFQSLSR